MQTTNVRKQRGTFTASQGAVSLGNPLKVSRRGRGKWRRGDHSGTRTASEILPSVRIVVTVAVGPVSVLFPYRLRDDITRATIGGGSVAVVALRLVIGSVAVGGGSVAVGGSYGSRGGFLFAQDNIPGYACRRQAANDNWSFTNITDDRKIRHRNCPLGYIRMLCNYRLDYLATDQAELSSG